MYGTEISLDIFQELKTLSELCRYISDIRNRSADKPYKGNFREKSGISLEEIAYTCKPEGNHLNAALRSLARIQEIFLKN